MEDEGTDQKDHQCPQRITRVFAQYRRKQRGKSPRREAKPNDQDNGHKVPSSFSSACCVDMGVPRETFSRKNGILILIGRSAAAQQPERFAAGIAQRMPLAGTNDDGVSGRHVALFTLDADPAPAVRDVVDFLGLRMIMFLRGRRRPAPAPRPGFDGG